MAEEKHAVFFSEYFGKQIFGSIQKAFDQKLICKLRLLNKMYGQQFEAFITTAHVDIENLKHLAKSSLRSFIQNLTVNIPVEFQVPIYTFHFLSTKYFVNIQSVDFVNAITFNTLEIYLNEDVFFRGLNVKKGSNLNKFVLHGNYKVTIAYSKFDGVELEFLNNSIVTIFNLQFFNVKQQNPKRHGLSCIECRSLKIDEVEVRDCLNGCYIETCQSVDVINFSVSQIGQCGCLIKSVPILKIQNTCLKNCKQGLMVENSSGYLKQFMVEETQQGVYLKNRATLYYQPILGISNQIGDVFEGNDCGLVVLT